MKRLLPALAIALALCFAAPSPSFAGPQPDEILEDAALERRAREISAGLRCLVCQNQSIDDSNAPLARDLRVLVRERLVEGDSDAEVEAFVVARYGEFVLLRPPVNAQTLILWGSPALVLIAGALGIFIALRRRRGTVREGVVALTPEEQAALDEILARGERAER